MPKNYRFQIFLRQKILQSLTKANYKIQLLNLKSFITPK